MKSHGWKSMAFFSVLCAFLALSLAGCPPWTHGPRVTIVKDGGEAVGISLSLAAGAMLALQAQSTAAGDSFSWSSSAPEVATVDDAGHVTAVGPGTATLTVTGSASHASASIAVLVLSNAEGEAEGESQPEGEGENLTEGEVQTEGEGEAGCREEPVQMIPFSGRFGYGLAGAFGFTGSLTKQALTDPAWLLEGTFMLPNPGYTLSPPDIRIQESYPEQVSVTMVITPPPPGTYWPQVIVPSRIQAEIAVANRATFKIRPLTCPPGDLEGEREGEGEVPGEGEGEGEWVPQGEAAWIPGDAGPAVWAVRPQAATEADVFHFSGPSAVYQNLCHAQAAVGEPEIMIDPSGHRIRLVFMPLTFFAPCNEVREPVAGIQGAFGPLEAGDWTFSAQSDADPRLNFSLTLHVGSAVPGPDPHVKPIPDDPDGNYLTAAEEEALGIPQDEPTQSAGEVPAGVRMAHQLFRQIEQLPLCPVPVPDAGGDPSTTAIPAILPRCKTPMEMRCTEECSVCGEPCNCGFVAINRPGAVEPATGVAAPLQVSFAALHYMQHGSLSFGWKNGAYAGRVDVVALVRLFNLPPDPLSELIGLFLRSDADGNGCLSKEEITTVVPSLDDKFFGLLQQLVQCPYAGPLVDGTVINRPQPVDEICFCGNFNATPELIKEALSAVLAMADADGDQSLSLAEAQAFVPSLTDRVFRFLDRNGDGFINGADLPNPPPPPPPMEWIANGQCPEAWTIDPAAPMAGSPIHFSGPTPTFGNVCEANSLMGTPSVSIDPAAQRIELRFSPPPGPVPCPLNYAPVCGLQGIIGPLREGLWTFFCLHPKATFQLEFTVQGGPPPANCVEARWIPGETGPKDWAAEILPLGAPVNGIRISGSTPVSANDCMAQAVLGGCPLVCRNDSARTLTLLFEGPAPDACYQVYAPVCGLAAQIIGIPNGTWTFSAPTLTPPVLLTFTIGNGPGSPDY